MNDLDDNRLEEILWWLTQARNDVFTADVLKKQATPFTSQVCFHSQLAAEKAIKAGLLFTEGAFPLIHDLVKLRQFLPEDWTSLPPKADLKVLSLWSIDGRYPSLKSEPSVGEAEEAYQQAKAVISAIEKELRKRGISLQK